MSVHLQYDEGMSALEVPTPNSRQLLAAIGRPLPAEEADTPAPAECGIVAVSFPFQTLVTVMVPICCESPTIVLTLVTCMARFRSFIQDVSPKSTCSKIRDWRRTYCGTYIVLMYGHPVFQTLVTVMVPICCESPNIGLTLATCVARSRSFIQDVSPKSTCSKIRDWRRTYCGTYIVIMYGHPV
jgi:hypothetical protein